MSDQPATPPDPNERVEVKHEGVDGTTVVRRRALKHMSDGWKVVGETTEGSSSQQPSGGDAGNDDAGSGSSSSSSSRRGRGGSSSQQES